MSASLGITGNTLDIERYVTLHVEAFYDFRAWRVITRLSYVNYSHSYEGTNSHDQYVDFLWNCTPSRFSGACIHCKIHKNKVRLLLKNFLWLLFFK